MENLTKALKKIRIVKNKDMKAIPVSYTHLDVYKRQLLVVSAYKPPQTELDVYKRQSPRLIRDGLPPRPL